MTCAWVGRTDRRTAPSDLLHSTLGRLDSAITHLLDTISQFDDTCDIAIMTNRRASINFKLDSEVASKPITPSASTIPERTKAKNIDAHHVVGDDELWADFQQRLRQSKHNVTAADTRRMFQEFLLEKKQKAAAERKSTSLESSTCNDESPTTEAQKPPSSLVEAAANSTKSSAKNFFRRLSMISSASSGHGGGNASVRSLNSSGLSSRQLAAADDDAQSRRGSLGSLGSLGALYNNIVGELSDNDEDDSDGEDLLGRMVDTLSSSPGRLGMLQKFGSERHLSSNQRPSLAAKEVQSNRCIYQMAQEVGNANSGIGASIAQSDTSQGQRARQGRRGSIADRLAHVAALAKVSLEDEIDGKDDDGHDNDGHGAYSGLR